MKTYARVAGASIADEGASEQIMDATGAEDVRRDAVQATKKETSLHATLTTETEVAEIATAGKTAPGSINNESRLEVNQDKKKTFCEKGYKEAAQQIAVGIEWKMYTDSQDIKHTLEQALAATKGDNDDFLPWMKVINRGRYRFLSDTF